MTTMAMPMMAGAVTRSKKARPRRGPSLSHTTPMMNRVTMFEVTEAMLPPNRSVRVSPRVVDFFRTGASGAGAKVEKKVEKKPNHEA